MELHPKSPKELHSQNNDANNKIEVPKEEANNEIPKERYISPENRQQIIDELRLV